MYDSFEHLLAVYCTPAFAGVKPACLMACNIETGSLEKYEKAFLKKGVRFVSVRTSDGRRLLLVYNVKLLSKRLSDNEVKKALFIFGYPIDEEPSEKLRRLIGRLSGNGGFPHEVGFFLGYPVGDVLGFVKNKGRKEKLCGLWKVYGDEASAKTEFNRLSRLCRNVTRRVEQGEPLLKIFAA